jgi:hypothetical protein
MLVVNSNGDTVDLPMTTFEECGDEEGYVKVSNMADMNILVTKVMGWESLDQFERDTGWKGEKLLGKFFQVSAAVQQGMVVRNRISFPNE